MLKQQFKIIVEQDEDGYFIASVPMLPGCHTQAKTLPMLRDRVKDAIALCLEESAENPAYRARIKSMAHEPAFIGMDMVEV
ncbi:MAG: type II toxin-antitoxin system HicB family antitoxin [bacterium]|nr:type II toxin-antitoxin system HicB family antitoxin [bacterium]